MIKLEVLSGNATLRISGSPTNIVVRPQDILEITSPEEWTLTHGDVDDLIRETTQ